MEIRGRAHAAIANETERLAPGRRTTNAVSVDYGPLTFSLKIGEKWTRYGKNENWPEWEVYPTTPWNYGLELSSKNVAEEFRDGAQAGAFGGKSLNNLLKPFPWN